MLRKRISLFFFQILCFLNFKSGLLNESPYQKHPALTNYWNFDQSSLNDIQGGANLYDGTNYQFVEDRFGRQNNALQLNNGYLKIPSGVYLTRITPWLPG
jgi:hypothetical protein